MIIKVKVKPNSNENKIEKVDDNEYNADITEKAEDNKANIELIKLLSKHFNISHKNIKIKNPKSRNKIVEIIKGD